MEQPQKTVVSNFDSPIPGYLVIAPLSDKTVAKIHQIQDQIAAQLPEGSVWLPRNEQLHITLLHVITDGAAQDGIDNTALFAALKDDAIRALNAAIPTKVDITLDFEMVRADPGAIIVKWQDDGTYDKIRNEFVKRFRLPEGTRQPPVIVHTTIARYRQEIPYADTQKAVASLGTPKITEHTTNFQLLFVKRIFLQEYAVLETFPRA